jgi:hypothetical protein
MRVFVLGILSVCAVSAAPAPKEVTFHQDVEVFF